MGLPAVTEQMTDCIERTVPMPYAVPPVLAMGAWFKNTLCVTSGHEAHISANLGDLDTPEACRSHEKMGYALIDWLDEKPLAIAHDLHPDFHSSRFAAALSAELQVPLIAVQHHHAHIAAVCAEHGVAQPVLGLALDGVGLGTDGTPWGGELLRAEGATFRRLGHLRPLPLPGGDRAAREPWRMAAAVLHTLGRSDEIARRFRHQPAAMTVAAILQRDFNCPRTSSMGRLFDAAAGLLGVCDNMEFEAQAAIRLERLAQDYGAVAPLADGYRLAENGVLDFHPLLAVLADCGDAARGAALFHATLTEGLAVWAGNAATEQGITGVALGGGCFLNKVLSQALQPALTAQGLNVLAPQRMAPGDSAISLGQAWIALRTLDQGV